MRFVGFAAMLCLVAIAGSAGERPTRTITRNVYFGDLHVHTAYSLDSVINLNPVGPREAYRFAMGQEVLLSGGRALRLAVPLDFAAVTEHAEYLGELSLCMMPGSRAYGSEICSDIRNETQDLRLIQKVFENLIIRDVLSPKPSRESEVCGPSGEDCLSEARTIWEELKDIAEEFNRPGRFTTFLGYEWTGNADGANMHRNVIFRDHNVPALPISYFEANSPADLWRSLNKDCTLPCAAIVIPHNSNQSRGRQFAWPTDAREAEIRSTMEPLVEMIQAKGESECRMGLGTADEECGFEKLDRRPICAMDGDSAESGCAVPCRSDGQPAGCVSPRNYLRNVFKDGLAIEKDLGVNPFKFGMVGGTDTHNGTPGATDERNYQGHHGVEDGSPEAREAMPTIAVFTPQRAKSSGGLTAIWAGENSRDELFSALKRKEVYATSGTRIVLQFFGGWDFPLQMEPNADLSERGYRLGVPMGGDLWSSDEAAARFIARASRGIDGAKLQRIQIVKGWLEGGTTKEAVYDVVCSDGLVPDDKTRRCPDNRARVDLSNCSLSDDRGAESLEVVWQDPDFDPREAAFYYARVLENPSCRWSTYESLREGKALLAGVDAVIQERAWSSPIWYNP